MQPNLAASRAVHFTSCMRWDAGRLGTHAIFSGMGKQQHTAGTSRQAEQSSCRVAAFIEACRRQGITATHQRREIYRELVRSTEHPDAQTICVRVRRRLPAVSLDTVYRTLRLFAEKGLAARVACQDARTRFDAVTERHHHFTCERCGRIQDLHSAALNAVSAPPEAAALGVASSIHVEVRGVCAACRTRKK